MSGAPEAPWGAGRGLPAGEGCLPGAGPLDPWKSIVGLEGSRGLQVPPGSGRSLTGGRQELAEGPTGTGRACACNSWVFLSFSFSFFFFFLNTP